MHIWAVIPSLPPEAVAAAEPVSVLEHEAPVHVVDFRGGLPGTLPIFLTCCGKDRHLHIWAEGKSDNPGE